MGLLFSHLLDNSNPRSLASRLRSQRSVHLRRLIETNLAKSERCSVIDLGGTANFWRRLDWFALLAERLDITLVNTEDEATDDIAPPFRFVKGDATDAGLCLNETFDVCHSNSVIEHVGSWSHKRSFARNVVRLGRTYVVQTPNYWFPIEPHFFCPLIHWLPRPLQVFLLTRFALGWSKRRNTLEEAILRLESVSLLTVQEIRALFPQANIHRERILGLTKSFLAVGYSPETGG